MAVKISLDQSALTNAVAIDAIQDTGKTELVNGYDAKIYTYTNSSMICTLWIVKDFPNFETIKVDLDKRDRLQSGLLHLSTLPGMLLKFRLEKSVTNESGWKPQLRVIVKEEPIDESIFEVPKDYHFYSTNTPVANTNEAVSTTNAPPTK